MIINQRVQGTQSNPVPGLAAPATTISNAPFPSVQNSDAVQLTRLGGVLNAFQVNADRSSSRIDNLNPLVRNQDYSVGGADLSRRLIAEMLNK